MESFLKSSKKRIVTAFLLVVVVAIGTSQAATPTISLGAAADFAVLGATGVTNADSLTRITGNVGSYPTPAVSGLTPAMVDGILYLAANVVTQTAQADLLTAYNSAASATGGVPGPGELGGATIFPGVYTFGTASWTFGAGDLTLDANGNPNAQWIFQIGTTLITPANANVLLINGASANNVFWQVGTSATLGATNSFAGNILAYTNITNGGGALNGRALALNGAVTISTAMTISSPGPSAGEILVYKLTGSGTSASFETDEPNGWILEKDSRTAYLVLDVNKSDPNILNDVQYIDYHTDKDSNNRSIKRYEIWTAGEDFTQNILPGQPQRGKIENIAALNVDLWDVDPNSEVLTGLLLGTVSSTDIGTLNGDGKKTKVDVATSLKGSYRHKSGEYLGEPNETLDEQGAGTLLVTLDSKWTKTANDPGIKGFGGNLASFLHPLSGPSVDNPKAPRGLINWLISTGYNPEAD